MKGMFVDTNLSAFSTWMTYFVQIALGYLTTRGLCALIHSPRIRLRLWGCFLFLTTAGWTIFGVQVSADTSVSLTNGSLAVIGNRGQWGFWPVNGPWAGHLAWFGPWAWRLYLSIVIIFVLQLLWKSMRLRSFLRAGQTPSEEVGRLFRRLCREMKVPRCDLILLGDLRSPATACWWRPRVILPTELVPYLDSGQLADVLRHELIHVRCRHYMWDRLAALGCRLVFFHPAVWFAHRRMRHERELACDLAVVQDRVDRRLDYAECLVKLARWWFLARRNWPGAIGFSSSESLLTARVRALLRETSPCSGLQQAARHGVLAVVATTAVCFLPSIGVTLYESRTWAAAPHADAAARRIISDPAYNVYQGHFSPDGRWIVFETTRNLDQAVESTLHLISAMGGPWLSITDGKYWDDKPRWSPDGKTIYFVSGRGGSFNVWGIRFDPYKGKPVGEPFRVTTFVSPGLTIPQQLIEGLGLSLSQNKLVLTMQDLSGSIWILDNVGP